MSSDEGDAQSMSGDEYSGSEVDFSDGEAGADFSGSEFGSENGDYEDDSAGSYQDASEDEMPALIKVGKNGKVLPKEERKEVKDKKRSRSRRDGDASDSEGEEGMSDTDYGYEKPHLNHIKSKEKNTYLFEGSKLMKIV